MKFGYALAGVILMTAMLSCQKSGVEKNNNVAANLVQPQGYSVSKDDYETFTKAIRRGDSNLSQLFTGIAHKYQESGTKIESLQPTHITTNDVGDEDLPEGDDEVQTVQYLPISNPYEGYLEDPWSGEYDGIPCYTYRGMATGWTQFTKRNTNLNIDVFYKYQYHFGSSNQGPTLWHDDQHPIPGVTLSGGNIGDLSSLQNAYINIPTQTGSQATGDASGYFDETRTVLLSTTGAAKLTASSAAVGINIGAEISAGFTVSSKQNSIMHYDWHADITWALYSPSGNYSSTPTAYMTIHAKSYGLQRD